MTDGRIITTITPDTHYRAVPASWHPNNGLGAFMYNHKYRWQTLLDTIKDTPIRQSIAYVAPLIWQLEPLAYDVARENGSPICVVQTNNLILIKPFCEEAGVDLIITSPEALTEIKTLLPKIKAIPKAMLVIHQNPSTVTTSDIVGSKIKIFNEIHLVPGLPLLYQDNECLQYSDAQPMFKLNPALGWKEIGQSIATVSSPSDWPSTFASLPLPFHIKNIRDDLYYCHV